MGAVPVVDEHVLDAGPNLSASGTAAALSPTARTLTQRSIEPGHCPRPSTGRGSSWPNIIGDANGEPSVTNVRIGHCGWLHNAMYDSSVPSEWATSTRVLVVDERLDAGAHLGRADRDRSP